MALVALEIPKVGLVMESARLLRWLKNVGDAVAVGEPLLEVETEKSIVEIEATVAGRLVEILLPVDAQASVGDKIAWVDDGKTEAASAQAQSVLAPATSAHAAAPAPGKAAEPAAQAAASERTKSSPVARRLAAEHGIDLSRIQGSGPRGRVQLEDVERAVQAKSGAAAKPAAAPAAEPAAAPAAQPAAPAAQPAAAPAARGPQPLSSMRRAVAKAMTLSNATIPQFSVERAVDWTALQAVRAELAARLPQGAPRLSVNDFLLQAVARALLEFPALNATFSGDPESPDARVLPAEGAHIGLVIAVENGLLVPVLHGVDRLGLAELARLRAEVTERGMKGRLKREELGGATFSISNLGTHGPDRFTAIINPPQSAILAVGRQRECVVAMNGGIHVRPMSELTLTVDHRLADGRLASEFLARLVEILEGSDWRFL